MGQWGEVGAHVQAHMGTGMLHAQSAKGACVCVCVCVQLHEWATVQVCETACTYVFGDVCAHEVLHTLEATCANVHTCADMCRCEHANVGPNVHTQGALQVCVHANVHAQVLGVPMEGVCKPACMYGSLPVCVHADVRAKAHKDRKRAGAYAGLRVSLHTRTHERVNTHAGARSCAHAHSAQTPLLGTSAARGGALLPVTTRERKCRAARWVAPPTSTAASAAFATAVAASADPPPP